MNGPAFLQEVQGRLRCGLEGTGQVGLGPRLLGTEGVPGLFDKAKRGVASPLCEAVGVVHVDGRVILAVHDQCGAFEPAHGGFDVQPVPVVLCVLVERPIVVQPLSGPVVDDLPFSGGFPVFQFLARGKPGREVGDGGPGDEVHRD